jgi:hypothetical protein
MPATGLSVTKIAYRTRQLRNHNACRQTQAARAADNTTTTWVLRASR